MRRSSISSSSEGGESLFAPVSEPNRREALAFVHRVWLFLLPLLLIGALSQFALWRAGEAWSMRAVQEFENAERGANRETLFARAVVAEEMRRYKLGHLRARKPEVVVLGSSTAMQLRSFHFGPYADAFYNAGGLVQHPGDLAYLADHFDRQGWPRFVALGLDLWWFNRGWRPSSKIAALERIEATSEFDADWAARMQAYPALLSLLAKPAALEMLGAPQAVEGAVPVGIAARGGTGFRGSDGSRRNARFLARIEEGRAYQDDEGTLKRIARGRKRFERGSFAPERVAEIGEFLVRANAAGAVVGGFLIPLDSEVRRALRSSEGHAAQFVAYQATLAALFERAQFPFVDAVDHFGLSDAWMMNGFHGSERSMAEVVRGWVQHPAAQRALPRLELAPLDCLILAAESASLVEGAGDCAERGQTP